MNGKLNEAQLELLKALSSLEEADFPEFKAYILKFKVKKLQDHIEKVFKEKGINPDDLLKEHLRTPYNPK
jgi:hypothetical protein